MIALLAILFPILVDQRSRIRIGVQGEVVILLYNLLTSIFMQTFLFAEESLSVLTRLECSFPAAMQTPNSLKVGGLSESLMLNHVSAQLFHHHTHIP